MNNTVALVPLRGGSKSISKKNIKLIAGKPLCAWVLEAACKAEAFQKVFASTEDEEIAEVVNSLNLNVEILKRPVELAGDDTTTEAVMLHFANEVDFDVLATIQATSPLVRPADFRGAMEKFTAEELDSLLTAVRVKRFFWNESGEPLNYDPIKRPMRQHFTGSFMENGAFYYTRKTVLDKYQTRLGGKIGIYEMPADTAVEIDEPEDWTCVEELLNRRKENSLNERLAKIKLLAMDCDGVLTDAGMYYGEGGEELKKFNTRDGMGLAMLREKGIKTAIITGEDSLAVKWRAEKLKIDDLYMGVNDKSSVIFELSIKYCLNPGQIAYIGDDINDLAAFDMVGLKFAVNDAESSLKEKADHVLQACGGKGAVREICNMMIYSLRKGFSHA